MRKFAVLLTAALLFLPSIVSAEKNYTNEKVVFLPQDFYVGDLVEMRVVIRPAAGVVVSKPETLPESYWIKIENADVFQTEDKYELRVFLRPYASGIRTLPTIQFGDVRLSDIKIQINSLLDETGAEFAPVNGPLMLPGTTYYIAIIVGFVLVLPLVIILFWTRLRYGLVSFINDKRKKRPYNRLMKVLKDLDDSAGKLKGNEFYTTLIDELRVYLSEKGTIDYSAATAAEGSRMIHVDFMNTASLDEIAELFSFSDEVKFGGKRVMIQRRESDLAAVREFAEDIESIMDETEKKHVVI